MNDLQVIRALMAGSDPSAPDAAASGEGRDVLARVLVQPHTVDAPARVGGPGRPADTHRRARRRAWSRPALLVLAVGLTLGGVASGLLPLGPTGAPAVAATPPVLPPAVGPAGPAGPVLAAVAAAARGLPSPAPAGPYRYVRTNDWALSTAVAGGVATSVLSGTQREAWTLPDGTGRVRTTPGEDLVDLVGSRRTLDALLRGRTRTDRRTSPGSGAPPLPDPAAVSTASPAAFARSISAGADVDLPAAALVAQYVDELFSGQPVPPLVRAGVWRLVAALPSARYRGAVADRTGRRGVAVTLDDDGQAHGLPERYLFVIDPHDGQLLEQDTVLTTPGKLNVTVPAVLELTLHLRAGYTRNDQDRP